MVRLALYLHDIVVTPILQDDESGDSDAEGGEKEQRVKMSPATYKISCMHLFIRRSEGIEKSHQLRGKYLKLTPLPLSALSH